MSERDRYFAWDSVSEACKDCGAIVWSTRLHDEFHDETESR